MGGPIVAAPRPPPPATSSPASSSRRRRWSGARTWRERALWRVLPIAGSWLRSRGYRRYLNRAVPKLIGAGHDVEPYVPWLLSEMSRNDPFAMVDAGRALADVRRPAVGVVARRAGRQPDHDRGPPRAPVEAAGARRRRSARRVASCAADHFAALSHPRQFAALTVELVDLVAPSARLDGGVASVARRRLTSGRLAEPAGDRVDASP